MITDENIKRLVDLFQARQVRLFHACQFADFQTYLKLGGIPSRNRLENSKEEFTAFTTDDADRNNGVWDKVFVNLSDFGTTFANGQGATPNTYGPILLVIDPLTLLEAEDIAITLRSAGASDFNREAESLSTCGGVDRLFARPVEEGYPASSFIKFKKELQTEFGFPRATNPEINCTYPDEIIPLHFVFRIIVDPYNFDGITLRDLVCDLTRHYSFKCQLLARTCKSAARLPLYQELAEIFVDGIPSFEELDAVENGSQELKHWIEQMQGFNLEWQYVRYARYLQQGTIYPILSMINC